MNKAGVHRYYKNLPAI